METKGSELQGLPKLHSDLEAILGYLRFLFKNITRKTNKQTNKQRKPLFLHVLSPLLPVVIFRAGYCWSLQCPVLWAGYGILIIWWLLSLLSCVMRSPNLVDWVYITSRTCFCIHIGRARRSLYQKKQGGTCLWRRVPIVGTQPPRGL